MVPIWVYYQNWLWKSFCVLFSLPGWQYVPLVFWRLRKFQSNEFLLWIQRFSNIGPNKNENWGLLGPFPSWHSWQGERLEKGGLVWFYSFFFSMFLLPVTLLHTGSHLVLFSQKSSLLLKWGWRLASYWFCCAQSGRKMA